MQYILFLNKFSISLEKLEKKIKEILKDASIEREDNHLILTTSNDVNKIISFDEISRLAEIKVPFTHLKTFEDFKGMKIRSAGGSASIALKMMGASPVMTIGGEYYQAMQKGVVDAGLMTTYSLKQYRLWEVADQVVDPPLVGYATTFMWMSLKAWDKLSKDQQEMFLKVARSRELWDKWVKVHEQEQDGAIIAEAKSRGVEFYVLPEAEAEKMYKATMPVWDWYITECERQGTGAEAREVRKLILDRFYANKK